MWYLVTVNFDEEHRNCSSVNASSEDNAKATVLARFHMKEQDVLSVDVVRAVGMDESKSSADYAKYGIAPKKEKS